MVGFADVKESDEDNAFFTKQGHKVVADSGYVDMPQPAGAASGVNEEWIYATGPMWYASSGLKLTGDAPTDVFNYRVNEVRQWLEGYGIFVFDPCPVTAVLVTYA